MSRCPNCSAELTQEVIVALKRVYAVQIGSILLKAGALMLLVVALNGLADFIAIRLTLALA